MKNLPQITPESTLGDLPLCDFQVSPATLGEALLHHFERRLDLPGAIVADASRVLGAISRRKFYEQIGRSRSRKAFLKQPIGNLINSDKFKASVLQLASTEKIETAIRIALRREPEDANDPLIVVFTDPAYPDFKAFFLADLAMLTQAQSYLLDFVKLGIHQQRSATQHYIQCLKQEQRKVTEYVKLLENQKKVIQERNLLLETQQLELLDQAREISQFNKRLIRIGSLLSSEGKKAFAATFAGVDAICQNTTEIVKIGRLLGEEIRMIRETSKLIEEVSRRVKHLAVQAAIVANQTSSELNGFSQITVEITKLVSQTYDAAEKTDRVADSFRMRIEELTESAHAGTLSARSLIREIEQAEAALVELEQQVYIEKMGAIDSIEEEESEPFDIPENRQALMKRIAQAETTLSELQKLVKKKEPGSLVEKIKLTLDKNKPFSNSVLQNSDLALNSALAKDSRRQSQ
ncbi:MAG: hypothetical protein SW833_08080 [Cyanobacteriota bacterium]|nr:hypothetical protein [Cyanobacteriota bacterium]